MIVFHTETNGLVTYTYDNEDSFMNLYGDITISTDSEIKQYFSLCLESQDEELFINGIIIDKHVVQVQGKYYEIDGYTRDINMQGLVASIASQDLDIQKDAVELLKELIPGIEFLDDTSKQYSHIMQTLKKANASTISSLIWSLRQNGLHAELVENIVEKFLDHAFENLLEK